MHEINIPHPVQQIDFSFLLGKIRNTYLKEALSKTIEDCEIVEIDRQLAAYVSDAALKSLAQNGLRGELIFPVPYLFEKNPYLLGYYRLLLGFSQKEFYTTKFGVSGFKSMEVSGQLSEKNKSQLPKLCKALVGSAEGLLDGVGADRISREAIDDLTLLTVGPQLRGGANVRKGEAGIVEVFGVIHSIVAHAATHSTTSQIRIVNAAGRNVLIEFAPDPDIIIKEELSPKSYRNILAIEVKAGQDFSNIHNRVGEAEKSHQKAKSDGYTECWTVINVDKVEVNALKRESPTTNRFYKISTLNSKFGHEYEEFKHLIMSFTGIS